jgi:hypothetical protein
LRQSLLIDLSHDAVRKPCVLAKRRLKKAEIIKTKRKTDFCKFADSDDVDNDSVVVVVVVDDDDDDTIGIAFASGDVAFFGLYLLTKKIMESIDRNTMNMMMKEPKLIYNNDNNISGVVDDIQRGEIDASC